MSGCSDPDRDGTEDPGSTPDERRQILDMEARAWELSRRRG